MGAASRMACGTQSWASNGRVISLHLFPKRHVGQILANMHVWCGLGGGLRLHECNLPSLWLCRLLPVAHGRIACTLPRSLLVTCRVRQACAVVMRERYYIARPLLFLTKF